MIKAISSKTFENLKVGAKDGMDTARKVTQRMRFRNPVVYEKPSSAINWAGLGFFAAAILAVGAWLYFRKRKEVADRYNMAGEGEGSVADWEAGKIPAGEHVQNPF